MLIAGPVLILINQFSKYNQGGKNSSPKINVGNIVIFTLASALLMLIPFALEYWAQQYLTAGKVSLIYSFSPSITALISIFLLKERITKYKLLGLIISFVGINFALVSGDFQQFFLFNISRFDLAMIAVVISGALGWILVEKLLQAGFSSRLINGVAMTTGGLGIVFIRCIFFGPIDICYLSQLSFFSWGLFFAILTMSNFIGYPLYAFLLKTYSPTYLSISGFLCPVLTAIFGYILLGESFSVIQLIISLTLGLAGCWLFSRVNID
jgi:drug/metabolite transporter (DMT)-like permease